MKTRAKISNLYIDIATRLPKVEFLIEDNEITSLQKLKGLNLNLEIKTDKRSLDANSYMWVLCDKIAKKLSNESSLITKEVVYKDAISNMGIFETLILSENALENFERIWSKNGLGYIVREVSRKDKAVKIQAYYGSSSYDKKEMTYLINYIVALCQELNIETRPKAEIDSLLKEWE